MALVIVGSFMIRYPMGGNLSWSLQWLVGLHQLGHEVVLVEKAPYFDACFDPVQNLMTDDCTYGISVVTKLLDRFGLKQRWCYVDRHGAHFGMSEPQVKELFDSADLFLDIGTHGAWLPEAGKTAIKVLVDGEPGYTQIKMEHKLAAGEPLPEYDHYYSNGANIGTIHSTSPTAGRKWRHLYSPVVVGMFPLTAANPNAPFSTVMNWKAHQPIRFNGKTYGQKDIEFAKFMNLPRLTTTPLEAAVSGKKIPVHELTSAGWRLRNGHEVTLSFDSYGDYIRASRGEFSVCKNIFMETNSGWFSDRSAAYLASGRPVVLQDTGFSAHLPCGEGLFAVRTPENAAAALDEITANYPRHSQAAREIAAEHLDASKTLATFLRECGI